MLDPMTSLLNRRGFEAKLKDLPASQYLAIAVFDIDNFKVINDTCGHQVGDDIICQVAKLLSNSLRQSDLIARFGGEEFVIAVTCESAELAQLILERVQMDISSPEIRLCDETIPVTASGGAVIYKMNKLKSAAQLWQTSGIVAADKLLYRAKKAGKNQIYIEIDNGSPSSYL
ncbi:GGDEF family protein [Vibrio ponticus]|nr:GGDEF family protein [Vibrio ponticus]